MKIRFVKQPNGKTLPLQKVRNVYHVQDDRAYPVDAEPYFEGDPLERYVSHFETCPKASSFTRKARPAGE
jgi:hypothetical protein